MNITHLEHAAYAILMQLICIAVFRKTTLPGQWLGAAFAIAWFVSREHTQREYKLFTFGEPNTLPPWAGFTGWSLDAVLDAVVPTIAVLLVGMAVTRYRRRRSNR